MKTANIINQINAGIHMLLENTKSNIMIDILTAYQGKDIPIYELKDILDKRFEEANDAVEEEE